MRMQKVNARAGGRIPLAEVSGLTLAEDREGRAVLLAVGDRSGVVAWASIEDGEVGRSWTTRDLDARLGAIPGHGRAQLEAVAADGAGGVLLVQEWPNRAEYVLVDGPRVVAEISLVMPAGVTAGERAGAPGAQDSRNMAEECDEQDITVKEPGRDRKEKKGKKGKKGKKNKSGEKGTKGQGKKGQGKKGQGKTAQVRKGAGGSTAGERGSSGSTRLLAASWADPKGSHTEGVVLLRDGHLLVVKEKDPPALVEFGPAGQEPRGFGPNQWLPAGEAFSAGEGTVELTALAAWFPDRALQKACPDLSDAGAGPTHLVLLSDKGQAVAVVPPCAPAGDPFSGEFQAEVVFRVRGLPDKPEGLAVLPSGDVLIACDLPSATMDNLVVVPRAAWEPVR